MNFSDRQAWREHYGYNVSQRGYTIRADRNLDGSISASDLGAFNSRFCPADVDDGSGTGNWDAAVTIDDLLYFVEHYDMGSLRADLDDGTGIGLPDGGVTVDDLLYFLERFDLGC